MTKAVGFDQKIQFNHLDTTANLFRHNLGQEKELYHLLDTQLFDSIRGEKSRKNAITMLMKIWNFTDENVKALRDKAIEEYSYLNLVEKKFVHYCLTCLAYPFFTEQVAYLGKHFKHADVVCSRTIVANMKDLYGERRRVEVAASAVFGSLKEWQLIDMMKVGQYQHKKADIVLENPLLSDLLLEVLLKYYNATSLVIETVNHSAIFFPFDYHIGIGDLNKERFTVFHTIRDTVIERNTTIPYSK